MLLSLPKNALVNNWVKLLFIVRMAGSRIGFLSRSRIFTDRLYRLPQLLMPFETNVFINCPFDKEYTPILRAILFTTIYLGFEPQISQTISSSEIRINQI